MPTPPSVGPDLDGAVEDALGYTHHGSIHDWYVGSNYVTPPFSTEIALAFQVLEHMEEAYGCDVEVGTHRHWVDQYGGKWFCRIHGGQLRYKVFQCTKTVHAPRPAEAICRAVVQLLSEQTT